MSGNSTPGTFDECADEVNDFVARLDKYPHDVLVYVLRAHLCGLVQALRAQGQWSAEEVEAFFEELASEARQVDRD